MGKTESKRIEQKDNSNNSNKYHFLEMDKRNINLYVDIYGVHGQQCLASLPAANLKKQSHIPHF
jgi:hypothetical protein